MTHIKKEEQERTKNNKEKFLENFEQSLCNVSACCKRVGISRNTFYTWRKEDEEFRLTCEEIEESLLDFAESMLMKKIRDGVTRVSALIAPPVIASSNLSYKRIPPIRS